MLPQQSVCLAALGGCCPALGFSDSSYASPELRLPPMETSSSGRNLYVDPMTPVLNVLLAEDPTRAPLRPLLREIPTVAIVAEATDGRVALPLIAAHQPDVALLDTALPGINGFDVAERSR